MRVYKFAGWWHIHLASTVVVASVWLPHRGSWAWRIWHSAEFQWAVDVPWGFCYLWRKPLPYLRRPSLVANFGPAQRRLLRHHPCRCLLAMYDWVRGLTVGEIRTRHNLRYWQVATLTCAYRRLERPLALALLLALLAVGLQVHL